MCRPLRWPLIAGLLAVHLLVTVGAGGLHALPGLGHETGHRRFASTDHSHGPGKTSEQAADDCLVCHFLAHGQIDLTSDHEGPVATACRVEWLPDVAVVPRLDRCDSSPRAPPRSIA